MLDFNQKNPDFKHVGDSVRTNSYYDIDFNFNQIEIYGTNAIDQALENVLMTEYGERLFNPNFGSPLQKLFFENNTNVGELREDVYTALESLLPIHIDRTEAKIGRLDNNPHILSISLDYSTTDGLVYGHHFERKFKL